ncbi:16S rRNA (uracil(1498)-N(3))-methyltransferase [Thermodesulfobacteriota bacterium]
MRRFLIEKITEKDGYCVITGSEARHISRVLRMGKGDRFILMDGDGNRFEAEIESTKRKELLVILRRPLMQPPPSQVEVILCQALLKSRPMDYLIEKTSELGVNRLIPFSSERTVVRLDGKRVSERVRHWQEIARSAAKQSDRIKPAEILPPVSFEDIVNRWEKKDVLKVIMWEEEEAEGLKELIRTSPPARRFVGMVGPEGGFSGKEIEIARQGGFKPVSLGNRILRAETAAIILVAIVQYEWGDLSLNV